MRKVYLQKKVGDNEFINSSVYMAWSGFYYRGYECLYFTYEDLLTGKLSLTKDSIVVGHINAVKTALKQLGVKTPENVDIPKELEKYAGRKIWNTTLGEIRKLQNLPVFIKPLKQQKIFTGHVINEYRDLIETAEFDDDFEILAQKTIHFISEWRFYILNKEIVACGHYNGDCFRFPDINVVESIKDDWIKPYKAYCIDVGKTKDGKTLLVEITDGFSVGFYSAAHPIIYSQIIETRWDEIINQ